MGALLQNLSDDTINFELFQGLDSMPLKVVIEI
jgi:hypothetical protein